MTDEQLTLCSNILPAYCFKTGEWVQLLEPEKVQPITWNDSVFRDVMLPPGHKELIVSFVEGHLSKNVEFDDIISGKGLGLLMLLVGPPGLGKTLTAEAVAEKLHRPLYVLSAAELGQTAESVNTALQRALRLAARWDAVLLLDECDAFLEERTSAKLGHNAIVAVFLR
jgi:hypothetical protein